MRRKWIKEEKPSVKDIIDKFPCLKDPKFVSHCIVIYFVIVICLQN